MADQAFLSFPLTLRYNDRHDALVGSFEFRTWPIIASAGRFDPWTLTLNMKCPYPLKIVIVLIITAIVVLLPLIVFEGFRRYGSRETFHRASPDGRWTAVITIKTVSGPAIPGPDPTPALSQEHQFSILDHGTTILKTPWHNPGTIGSLTYQGLDILWSTDSRQIAHRRGNDILLFDTSTRSLKTVRPVQDGSCIASYKWIAPDKLVILARYNPTATSDPGSAYATEYHRSVRIALVEYNIVNDTSRQLATHEADAAYTFRSLSVDGHELSPFGDRVAFSNRRTICVYDWSAAKWLAEKPLDDNVHAISWADADHLRLSIGPTPTASSDWEYSIKDHGLTKGK